MKNVVTEDIKPTLSILVDNSLSSKYFKQKETIQQILKNVKEEKSLNKKFDVSFFSFGTALNSLDSLQLNENQTNIDEAITTINELQKNKLGGVVLLSDGNQTIGNDYEFTHSKQAIYPIVLGDTTAYKDIRISQLNVNKYSYLKNKFPVETTLFYEGKAAVNTSFYIYHKGKAVFSKKVTFTPTDNVKTITANLTSNHIGKQFYTASVKKISDEKNTKNNTKNFSIEVLDEQTNVLILSSIMHPDLGSLKRAIESNKQRKATIKLISNFKGNLTDYQLAIFYQPNYLFKKYLDNTTANYLLISGTKTDWNLVNKTQNFITKKVINQSENYQASYNTGFLTFQQKNIGFDDFPPLEDKFGDISMTKKGAVLFYQKLKGIQTTNPLLVLFEENNRKVGFLLGENSWKWRSASFIKEKSFEKYDEFIGNILQYLATNKKRKRLEVSCKSLFTSNAVITITAQYLDKNYAFDNRATLQLKVTNTDTKAIKTIPFSLVNNTYLATVEGMPSGNYSYKVSVDKQNLTASGRFKITDYQIEEQFTNANTKKLQKLAIRTGGKLFFSNQEEDLFRNLVQNKKYYTTQKSTVKEQNLIDWKWLLLLASLLLAVEWFIRKYYGKI